MNFLQLIGSLSVLRFSMSYDGYQVLKSEVSSCGNCSAKETFIFNVVPQVRSETGLRAALRRADVKFSTCGPMGVDIRELTISKAQFYFRTGILSSLELTECYLKRIEAMDVYLKSVIEVNPDALAIALRADFDRQLTKGQQLGPLHGIPILIKDNIGTADKMQTTAGAVAMENVKPKNDADVVTKLRAAGAVILGKTNPSEWAYFRSCCVPSGWSGRGGQTLSPYNLTGYPSGSSTGSAVSIAANLAVAALGTETDGSIISPSGVAALVGLKPTLGKVSTDGVIPIGFSQDVVGPMTRTALDAAILMEIISEVNNTESFNLESKLCQPGSKFCTRKFNIGVPKNFWNTSDSVMAPLIPVLKSVLKIMEDEGPFVVQDPVSTKPDFLEHVTSGNESLVLRHEFKYGINKYLKHQVIHREHLLGRSIRSLTDIIQFNEKHPPKEGYNQTILVESNEKNGIHNETYLKARRTNKIFAQRFLQDVMQRNELDALASPCEGDRFSKLLFSVGAIAGYPSITVPVGTDSAHMPFGICFLGNPNCEDDLLRIAYLLEKILHGHDMGRVLPKFVF